MDISSLFGSAFQSPTILELSSDLVVPLSYPGGFNVSAVEGRFLSNESSWKELSADSFISAEEVLNSLCSISGNIRDMMAIPLMVSHSNGKCRRVSIHNELSQKQNVPEVIHTFIPVTVVMGLLLLNLHKFEVSKKLLFAGLVRESMVIALDAYPRQGHDNDGQQHVHRTMDSNPCLDEFEESLNLRYKENYRTMRYLIPPNIARTDLRKMLADGVPQKIADRVWRKKALWLLCMHPSDIPKVHIADLRGKYDCFGLDIVELGAVWHILPRWEGGSPKAEWRRSLKSRLDELVSKELAGKLSPSESRDAAYQSSEGLRIYDPDRTLHRQFGVSASAAGLQPGQRRNAVFTSVDLRLTTVSQAFKTDSPSNPSHSAYHSPNTDSEKEGESTGSTRLSGWARCGSVRDIRENLILSDSESGKRRKNGTGGRMKHRRKKKAAKGGNVRQDSDPGNTRTAAMMPLSPLSGHLLGDKAADMDSPGVQKGEDKDDDECTDRDAELDDLLNYEINLSCLDLDLDLADCLYIDSDLDSEDSCCESEESAEEDDGGWRVVSEDAVDLLLDSATTTPSSRGVSPHSFPAPRAKQDLRIKDLALSTDGAETTPSIENFRPFTAQAMIKKPMKRLNFIAAPAKTAERRQWLSSLDSSGQINFDATPDFVYDHGRKRSFRPAQKKAPSTPSSCTAKKAQGTGKANSLPAWGSAGAKRRSNPTSSSAAVATPSRQSLSSISSEASSPLETIYSESAVDREMFDFNPQLFSSNPTIAIPFDISGAQSLKNNTKLFESFNAISFQSKASSNTAYCSDIPYSSSGTLRSGSRESLTATDRSAGLTSLHTPEHERGGSAFERRSKQMKATRSTGGARDSADKSFEGCIQDSVVHLHSVDSIAGSTDRQTESASVFAFPTFSINSMQSAAKRLFTAPSKGSRSAALDGHMESERESAQDLSERESEDEIAGDGVIYDSPCQLSPFNDGDLASRACLDGSGRRRSNSLNVDSAWITPKQSQNIVSIEDQHKLFSKTFTTQSPKMDRRISQEDELVDNEIEAEIDNFIVPDELSPVALRRHGVVMGLKEVNGIRQNALMSLPALLLKISKGSMNNSEDADEEGIEEMSENELGLWGDDADADPDSDQEEGTEERDELSGSQRGKDGDTSDNIDRLVSGDANPTPPIKGILKGTRSSPRAEPRGRKTGCEAVYWIEDSDTETEIEGEDDFVSADTDSESSTYASKKPLKSSLSSSAPHIPAGPVLLLTPEEAEDLILYKEARLAWMALETGALMVSAALATELLLKLSHDPESVMEPLETLVLLVDKLGADVNATDRDSMTPLHALFSNPALGRFILSRGGDVLMKDDNGDSVLTLCAEYGYNWVLPAFISMHGREAKLLEDPVRAHEYAVILLALWGFGRRVKELVDEGIVSFSADEALELLDSCAYNFGNMKEPVETFELLESLILKE